MPAPPTRRKAAGKSGKRTVAAMKNKQSPTNAKGAPNGKGADEMGAGNLDKVRDILFGEKIRDNERRFARLEDRLSQDTIELKEDVRKRLSVLEQFVKTEVEALADRIKAEHESRTDAEKDLTRDLREAGKATEKRFSQIEDQIARVQRELRQQILDMHQQINDEIQRQVEDVLARLARDSAELREEKLDRAMLATLLTEVAMRLNNELSIPGVTGE
jgi:DNA anti-recombination protein RmuC